jgi:glycosyltransferase involved in cell wall biosynthesis
MPEKAKVSVCLIVRDEPLLEQCLQSFRDYVDEIVIVDTGSKDNTTIEISKKYADIFEIYTDCNDPETGQIENFSKARQKSFDLATNKSVIWIDSDDVLAGSENFLKIVSDAQQIHQRENKPVCYLFPYEYAYNEVGEVTCRHYRERFITDKDQFHWVNWVHEVLVPRDGCGGILLNRDDLIFKHKRQYGKKSGDPGRNLRILKKFVQINGDSDARQLYYLGLEYNNNGFLADAVKCLEKYISLSGWPDEIVMACLKLVDIHQGIGNYQEGLKWGFKAIETKHDWCEGYLAVSRMFYFLALKGGTQETENWKKCVHFAKVGLSFPPTQTVLFINPFDRESEIHKYFNIALNKTGDVKGALESVNTGLKKEPNSHFFLNNKKIYETFLAVSEIVQNLNILKNNETISSSDVEYISSIINGQKQTLSINKDTWNIPEKCDLDSNPIEINSDQLVSSVIMLWKQYMLHNDVQNGITFLENTPSLVKSNPIINNALYLTKSYQNKTTQNPLQIEQTKSLDSLDTLDIVFFAGNGFENWTPESIKQNGIGGSELMMHELSKRLAKLGHKVRIYNSCGEHDGKIFEGVQYLSSEKYHDLNPDVCIVSRRADALDDSFNVKSKLTLLWVHDIFALNATNERLLKADKILALSNWHKDFLIQHHNVHPDHVLKTRNGIDLNRFNKKVQRNRFKCINSSSPDRSWPVLLDVWPKIKERVPEAELHLFYGFNNWEIAAQNNTEQMNFIQSLKDKIQNYKSIGVVYHGRVNQEELAQEFLSSGVWIYPTWFNESSCLSAMEAQAGGCRMVTSSIAALNETAGDRAKLISGEWTSPEYQSQFINACVYALQNTDDTDRLVLQEFSKNNFGLDELAKKWNSMFFELMEAKKINPLVPYQPTNKYR